MGDGLWPEGVEMDLKGTIVRIMGVSYLPITPPLAFHARVTVLATDINR